MSRLGKKPVPVGKAKLTLSGQKLTAEGPKGKLELNIHPRISVKIENGEVQVTRNGEDRQAKALHGLTRALIANMVEGVTNGYRKALEVQGVGYKAEIKGKKIALSVGFANVIEKPIPANVSVAVEGSNKIVITGADRQAVGQFAAEVRSVKRPEPYQGKGIRYEGEVVRIKPGKAFAGK